MSDDNRDVQYLLRKGAAGWEDLLRAIDGFDASQFEVPPAEDAWSMRQLLSHIGADAHGHVVEAKAILGQGAPFDRANKPWQAAMDAALEGGFETTVAWMQQDRAEQLPFLEALTDADLSKAAMTGHGEMTIHALMKHYANHGKDHAEQARQIRAVVDPSALTYDKAQELVARGDRGLEEFIAAVQGFDMAQWEVESDKGWSMRHLVAHMAGNTQGHVMVARAILEGTPTMTGQNQPWREELDAVLDQGLDPTIAWMRANHEAQKSYLYGITADDLGKKGVGNKAESGMLTLLKHYASHGTVHANQARKIRNALGC
jgi:uncharacterized damage-inducible protein DinB